ncbi:uncharacterized protein LOC120183124, partial [Hibiscus syriacus]|uniref:uncharacterized protein LOC120183124 n=1 Tax=Hibiscus syriacus TaxID=106335 RepID=UPI0019230984
MVKIGWLTFNANENKHACPYHRCEDHVIQSCDEFKALVQRLMDSKDMEFYHKAKKEKEIEICASEDTSKGVYNTNCPLVITPKAQTMERLIPKIVITPPSSFPYKDNKQVPWRYGCQLKNVESSEAAKEEVDEVGHFTRSGRCYSSNQTSEPEKRMTVDKGKRVEILLKNDEPTINEPVTENDATFVPKDVPVEKIDRLVANIQADNFISFSDDEIPSGMMGNPKALHITIQCKGHALSRVLIDNGSALNVMPLVTLKKLPVDSTHMRNCQSIVRAFDGTKKEVLGKIDIPLTIGPSTYEVEFLVMDIMPSYNCLLGRPWIHQAGVVPSTLHQKLKFVIEGRLVCLNAEEDIIASISTTAPYVEVDEDAVECSFRALEFINATFVAERKKIPKPRLSNCTKMGLKMTLGRGAKVGRGLGSRLQGNISPVFPGFKLDRFGLGYHPTLKEKLKMFKRARKREPGGHMFQGDRSSKEPIIENALRDLGINVISEEGIEDGVAMDIYPAPPGF